ncbi:MAG TPA: ABC transporter substrate binding protein [Polyangia bacterium]|nr:ABC transporter substrate binding protein [Polyangia bacterium]
MKFVVFISLIATAVGGGARAATTADPGGGGGVCVLAAGDEHRDVADEIQRTLGARAQLVDVRKAPQPAEISRQCGRMVVAVGREALRAAVQTPESTQVVFSMVSSPGALLNGKRPVSGVSLDADPARIIALLKHVEPRVRRIGAVYNPHATGALVAAAEGAARANGVELVALPVTTIGDAIKAFHRFEHELPIDALWLLPDATATAQETVRYALELADWKRISVVGLSRWYVAQGALFALAPQPSGQGAQAARMALDLLRGGPPQGVRYASDYALLFNTRAAHRLGIRPPPDVLDHAELVSP